MATATRIVLSGSTDGRNIKISATVSGSANTIHTVAAVATATQVDEIYIFAYNSDTVTRTLTVLFGGTTSPDDEVKFDVPPTSGPYLVIPGWPLGNSLIVKAFAQAANVVTVNGYVNRIVN